MELSVVVCTWNRADSVSETLDALAGQVGLRADATEVVLIDNASTDDTEARIRERIATFPFALRYLHCPLRGLSRVRNVGVAASRGDAIAFTDDDCRPRHDWARRLLDALRNTGAHAVGGRVLLNDAHLLPTWAWRRRTALAGVLPMHDLGPGTFEHPDPPAFIGANMAFRREAIVATPFLEGFGLGAGTTGEDTELFRRMRRNGLRIAYAGDAVVFHKLWPDRLAPRYLGRWYAQKAKSLFALHGPAAAPRVIAWTVRDLLRIANPDARSDGARGYTRPHPPESSGSSRTE